MSKTHEVLYEYVYKAQRAFRFFFIKIEKRQL